MDFRSWSRRIRKSCKMFPCWVYSSWQVAPRPWCCNLSSNFCHKFCNAVWKWKDWIPKSTAGSNSSFASPVLLAVQTLATVRMTICHFWMVYFTTSFVLLLFQCLSSYFTSTQAIVCWGIRLSAQVRDRDCSQDHHQRYCWSSKVSSCFLLRKKYKENFNVKVEW